MIECNLLAYGIIRASLNVGMWLAVKASSAAKLGGTDGTGLVIHLFCGGMRASKIL